VLALLLRLAIEVLGQPWQPLAFEIGGDRHVLEHCRELMPDLLGKGGFHLGGDQHVHLLYADVRHSPIAARHWPHRTALDRSA
jgi:hypothetical protein